MFELQLARNLLHCYILDMEGILGIFGIAVLVMEGVELFHSSSTNTLVAAGVACIVYIFYKFCDFSKKDPPEEEADPPKCKTESKHVWPFSQHMDDYIKEYLPEKYDDYCEEYSIAKKKDALEAKESLDAAKYAKPTTKTVSAELQRNSSVYIPDHDIRQHITVFPGKHLYMFVVCYNHFDIELTLIVNNSFDISKVDLDKYPKWKAAYKRAGCPKEKELCSWLVEPKSDSKGTKPYIPADLAMSIKTNVDLDDAVNEVINGLSNFFNAKPCYFYQY